MTRRGTSRTSTSKWRNLRARALYKAQQDGLTYCPQCRVRLDYTDGLYPTSATPDHIQAWTHGDHDNLDNLQGV